MKNYIPAAGSVLLLVATAACSGTPSFKVKGVVDGGNGQSIVLEKPDFHGQWSAIDSTYLSKEGAFSMKSASPAGPEIYRLRIDDRYVYFPVDSIETVSVETSLNEFGHLYTLSGSDNAELLSRFENDFARFGASPALADSTDSFKKRVFSEYIRPYPGSVVAYHILTKTLSDGKALYNMTGGDDYRYLAAVATGFKQLRPDDPHTAMLEAYAVEAIKERNRLKGKHQEFRAQEISLLPLELADETGKMRSLVAEAGKGEPVILVFSSLTDGGAPLRNKELMERYSKGGLRIFQVSYDGDQYAWREAAANIPWVTVNDPSAQPRSAVDYNVTQMPLYYYIDSSGNLTKRAPSLGEL